MQYLITLSGEIHTKSRRTARWFRRALVDNVTTGFRRRAVEAEFEDLGNRLVVTTEDDDVALDVLRSTFGIHRVDRVRSFAAPDLDEVVSSVVGIAGHLVVGRTFAVRFRRRGTHDWSSQDASIAIGAALRERSAGVNLGDPEVEVRVDVMDREGFVVERSWDGPGGVPLGTQLPVLSLLSGGFDSPVAAWMMMRRGCPTDFVHFKLDCAASDHAMVVAHDLWRRWGTGTSPTVWMLDFQPIKESLYSDVPPRLRQVVLKQLMFAAADRIADRLDVHALVTGESVGQVSSQTLAHLAEIDTMVSRTVLRPLAGFDKHEIIARARRIGTEGLSARAKEVCDLSDGPVAIAAQRDTLIEARAGLPADLVEQAIRHAEVVALEHWLPGFPLVPVVRDVPTGWDLTDGVPPQGTSSVLHGEHAVHIASRLHVRGEEVAVLDPGVPLP